MTIPPKLAALQRYIHNSAKMAEVPSCQTLIGVRQFVDLDDVARAWPQRASGEAKPVAWKYVCNTDPANVFGNRPLFSATKNNWADNGSGLWTETPLYTHPADTSALRECLRECANRLSDFIIRYDNAQPADPHEIGLLHRHFAEARVALERARTLLAGEGNE